MATNTSGDEEESATADDCFKRDPKSLTPEQQAKADEILAPRPDIVDQAKLADKSERDLRVARHILSPPTTTNDKPKKLKR